VSLVTALNASKRIKLQAGKSGTSLVFVPPQFDRPAYEPG